MFKVIADFVDLQDNNHKYRVGDEFPRPGVVVTDARIDELKTDANRLKKPLIKAEMKPESKQEEKPKTEKPKTDKPKADNKPKKGRKKNAH